MANTVVDVFNRANAQGWGATTNFDGVSSASWSSGPGTRLDRGVGVIPFGGDTRPYGATIGGAGTTGDQLVKLSLSSPLVQALVVQSQTGGGYVGVIVSPSGLQLVSASNYGITNQGGPFSRALVAKRFYWVRLTVTTSSGHTTLAAKIWQDLMPEPASAQISTTIAATFPAGQHGVYGYWPITAGSPGTEVRVGVYAEAATSATVPTNKSITRGLNSFGAWQSPYGGPNIFSTDAQLSYYASTGLHTLRTPMLWEGIQTTKGAALDTGYLAKLDSFLASCKKYGLLASLTFIRLPYGSANASDVDITAFANMWKLVIQHVLASPNADAVWCWDLCNEPYQQNTWNTPTTGGCQTVINAIRSVDMTRTIQVMSFQENTDGYTGLIFGTPPVYSDPANNMIYCVHIYFDANDYGQYSNSYDTDAANGVTPAIGIQRAYPPLVWAATNNAKMMVTEYGIPGVWNGQTYDGRWGRVIDNFLRYLDANATSGNYWEVGPYGDTNSVEPVAGVASPIMPILTAHGGRNNLP